MTCLKLSLLSFTNAQVFQSTEREEQKTMAVLLALFLVGSLFLCDHVEATASTTAFLKEAALKYQGQIQCEKWDCNCTFERQRGCCCAAKEMHSLEDDTLVKMFDLWGRIEELHEHVEMLIDNTKISFKANMNATAGSPMGTSRNICFGPFNTNVPIPYGTVTLNDGSGYNPCLGVFTAPCAGVYVFSVTVYSFVGKDQRLYHQVEMLFNGVVLVGVWENNREDGEDSATQVVTIAMKKGDQVYVQLISGRMLCNHLEYNIFTGYMLYPSIDNYST